VFFPLCLSLCVSGMQWLRSSSNSCVYICLSVCVCMAGCVSQVQRDYAEYQHQLAAAAPPPAGMSAGVPATLMAGLPPQSKSTSDLQTPCSLFLFFRWTMAQIWVWSAWCLLLDRPSVSRHLAGDQQLKLSACKLSSWMACSSRLHI